MPIHCHQNCNQMCLNMGYVVDGVVIRQKTDDAREDSFDCPQQRWPRLRGRSLRQQVYNADRMKYPMKRKQLAARRRRGHARRVARHGRMGAHQLGRGARPTSPTSSRRVVRRATASDAVVRNALALGSRFGHVPRHRRRGVRHRDRVVRLLGRFQTEALGLYAARRPSRPHAWAPTTTTLRERRYHRAVRLQPRLGISTRTHTY